MDNLLSSVESVEKFETYKTESITVMANACMQLQEWHSSPQPESKWINVLGLSWDNQSDLLLISNPGLMAASIGVFNCHVLSSCMQRVFDPCSYMVPALMLPKIWLQESWWITKDWDQQLPDSLLNQFQQWLDELSSLWAIGIDRHLHFDSSFIELHVFCDASTLGYATVSSLHSHH